MKYILLFLSIIILSGINSNAQVFTTPPGGIAGYIVTDLSTGHSIVKHNETVAFVPASILKCVTTAAALDKLGGDFRFKTKAAVNGIVSNDTLYGSLAIIPSGDPSLDSSFAQEIASLGIKHVTGNLNVLASDPKPVLTCMLEDVGTEYGVGWTEFNYNNNEMLVNDYMVPMPLSNLISEFEGDLRINGINIYNDSTKYIESTDTIGDVQPEYRIIHEYKSKPLSYITKSLMHKSDNLAAESVGRALDSQLDFKSALSTLKSIMSSHGLDTTTVRIVDFNGLSRTNLITPAFLNTLLVKMKHNNNFINSFPRVGQQGTVRRLLSKTPLEGRLALKSGSMTGVLAYAGYKLDTNGKPTHSVVIIVNNTVCKQSEVKRAIERWLLKIF